MTMPNPSDKSEGEGVAGYTPGPWEGCIRFSPVGLDGDFNLAWLTAEPGSPRDLEARANARLIRAAPEMHAALTAARQWLEVEPEERMGPNERAVFDQLLAVIDAALSRLTKE